MFCSNCGVKLVPEASFCVSCGAPTSDGLNKEESAVQPGSPARRAGRGKWLLGALAVVGAAAAGGYLYVNNLAKARLDELLGQIESKVTLTYADARANPFTQAVIIEGINVTSIEGQSVDGLTIDRVQVKGAMNREADPEKLDIRLDGLKLDIARMGPKWGQALMMDAGMLELDSHLNYEFSRSAGNLDVNEFEIVAHDMATVRASLNLGNVPANTESLAETLVQPTTSIRRAEFMVENAVFIDHLIRMTAQKQKMSPEELKQRLTEIIPAILGDTTNKLESDVSAALLQLINKPSAAIRFTATPAAPVTIAEVKAAREPARQLEMLNIQVESEH